MANTKIYLEQGGEKMVAESGATVEAQSGSTVNVAGTFQLGGTTITETAARLNKSVSAPAASKVIAGGTHVVTAGEDTANTVTIATGLTTIAAAIVQIVRAAKVVSSDPAVSFSNGNLVVADGSTYVLTNADVINWIVFGG